MKIECKTNTWQPGTWYGPEQAPVAVTYTGTVYEVYYDPNWRDKMFVIWDKTDQKFRSVRVSQSMPVDD